MALIFANARNPKMTIAEVISALEAFTIPPPKLINYMTGPDARVVIDEVLDTSDRTSRFGNFNDEAIKSIINYILNMFMTPLNLRGALLLEPCANYMLNRAFEEVIKKHAKSPDAIREINAIRPLFMAVAEQWFHRLRQSDIKYITTTPAIKASLPLSFHVTAFEESTKEYNWKKTRSDRKLYPFLYEAFAYSFHLRIMNKLHQPGTDTTKLIYERLPRYAFQYASTHVRDEPHEPDNYTGRLVKDWITNYHKAQQGEEAKIASTSSTGYAKLWPLFWDRAITIKARRYYVRRASAAERIVNVEGPDGTASERKNKAVELSYALQGLEDDEPNVISPYEPPLSEFLNFYGSVDRFGDVAKEENAGIPDGSADFIQSHNISTFWDFTALNLHHYAFLYEAIEKARNDKSQEAGAIVLYFLILIHTGIEPRFLQDLMVLGKNSTDESLDLTQIGGQYYILIPSIMRLKSVPSHADTYPTAKKVHIPVPPAIAKLIPAHPADNKFVFSFKAKEGVTRLSNDQILPFLQNINDAYGLTTNNCQHGLNITLESIAVSFYSLYCDFFGFDPYMACYISQRDHKKRYGAKLHYVHIPHQMLEQEYLKAFDEIDFRIRENLYNSMKRGTVRWNRVKKPQKGISPVSSNVLAGYGSPFIPRLPYVRERIEKLRDAVIKKKDHIKRHNLYIVYLYLGLQFATTLRPHNNPQLYWLQYNRDAGVILIFDKQSGKYNEHRILVLPRRIRSLLKSMQDAWPKMHDYIMVNHCMSYQHDKIKQIFFHIGSDGVLVDFTNNSICDAFNSLGLDFTDPMNMPRQYTRNYFYHNNISHQVADILMGHQSEGREVFNLASTTSLARAAAVYLPVLDRMLDEIGFTEVEYLPL
jgi:hypothetical protein